MTRTINFRTNLNCHACVAAVRPFLDNEPSISSWDVDVSAKDKTLTVRGDDVSRVVVREIVAKAGFKVLDEMDLGVNNQRESQGEQATPTTYYPLILILFFLFGTVALVELNAGSFEWGRAMSNFMGSFFLVFSFFKLLDIRGFADSYQMYDVVAKRFRSYGYLYPFIELVLGIAYLTNFQPAITNTVTLVIMSVSAVGVINSLLAKRKIRCACLGTVFNLPMSTVTLVEDSLMAGMAGLMLFIGSHGPLRFERKNHPSAEMENTIMRTQTHLHHGSHHNASHASSRTSLSLIGETELQAGQTIELQLLVKDSQGNVVKDFETIHDERVHLVIVRDGLDTFTHLHPQVRPDGSLTVKYAFPVGGRYRLFADFQPKGMTHTTASTIVDVQGESPLAAALIVNAPGRVAGEGWLAEITVQPESESGESRIQFELLDSNGRTIQDLKPYMGAWGHLQLISADGSDYVHSHPMDNQAGDSTHVVTFHAVFQKGGIYKGWGQFRVGDTLRVIPFVIKTRNAI
ncbi:MAG: heavy-metal-associated domain-containing protein [Pirellulaceae bacterium]|nr:heavy-metal-associated domain-containing protein [Pirellulaceae bacterium]